MKCGVISRLKVVLLHGTEHLWPNFVLAHQICVGLICVFFSVINAGGCPRESHGIAICKSEWCKDNSICIEWSFFFFKISQTWITGIYNLYSGLKMKSRGLGISVTVQVKLGAEKNILLTIVWCAMLLLSLNVFHWLNCHFLISGSLFAPSQNWLCFIYNFI